jgi:hypothetical protein
MTWRTALRVAAGIAIGLGLASVPFLQYGLHAHQHATNVAHSHR